MSRIPHVSVIQIQHVFYLCHRPGYNNIISLSGTKIDADDNLKKLDPVARNCLFQDETDQLIIHRKYTQSNCFFECSLVYAKNKTQDQFGLNKSW